MSYIKQNFQDGNVLSASQLNHMETGIEDAHSAAQTASNNAVTANNTAQAASISASNAAMQAQTALNTADNKQDRLVSGVNIKTINGQDLLGEGDVTIEGGGSADLTGYLTKDEASTTYASKTDLQGKQEVLVSGTNIKKINGRSLLGSGNIVIEGGAGGTESGYIAELNGDEVCDYYAINKSGEHVAATGYGCTSYIDCYGCGEMEITNIQQPSATNYGIAFYDENKTFLSFVATAVGSETKSVLQTVTIPEEAHYFRATFFNYEQQKKYGEFSCSLVYQNGLVSKEGKRPYQDGYIFFSQRVNQSVTAYYDTSQDIANKGEYKVTTGVIALPNTYNPTGKKTPVILYAHGLSHYAYYGTWGNTDTFREQKQHWLDMGFAVIGCNGARDNNKKGQFASGICPQGVNGYKQCLDYALEHYNLDPQVFLFAGSAGGAIGWNFLSMYGQCVKAAVFVAAYADIKDDAYGGGGQKNLFKEFLGFTDASVYEVDKTIGFDPILKIVTVNGKKYCFDYYGTPIYGLYGSQDTYALINNHKAMFEALRNAGATAQLRRIEGVGHEIVSGAILSVDVEIGNWFLSHWGDTGKKPEVVKHNVTYRFVDEDGNQIQSDVVAQVLNGVVKDFTENVPSINGYSFVSASPTNATVTADTTVTYTYRKLAMYNVTYKYVNESGTNLQDSVTQQVVEGTVLDFTKNVPTFENHAFVSVVPTDATITGDLTVTFSYKETVTHAVTYKYVDESGNEIADSITTYVVDGTEVDFANEIQPSISGYKFTSVSPTSATVTQAITVTFTYSEVSENDLTGLFSWNRLSWMAVSNPQWKSSGNFMSCFADLSAYAGKTIRVTVPQYTSSAGSSSTGMTMWCTQPIEDKAYIHTRVKVWDVDTNGNGKGVLAEVETVVPAEAPYLWTSTYMDGVSAYVGPNSGREDFRCYVVD